MRALIVDDYGANRTNLSRMIAEFGFTSEQAADGEEELATLAAGGSVDVVLLDWHMPKMDGMEFLERLRGEAGLTDQKVLMVTTEVDVTQRRRAMDAGADGFLGKPFSAEMLASKLRGIGILEA